MNKSSHRSFFQQTSSKFEWFIQQFPIKHQQFQLIDEFTVVKDGIAKTRQFKLINNYLIIKSLSGNTKWMNYENSTLEIVNDETFGLGLILSKGEDQLKFYGEIEVWCNTMRKFAIQSNFDCFYVLLKEIGRGSFAQVFLARNKYDGMEYAIKYIQKKQKITEIDKDQLLKEISILRQLQHESIMRFHGAFESQDGIYIVTEYLPGGDLLRVINDKTECLFSEFQIAQIIFKLLKVIAYIHSKHIMHRDLKPENILFRKQSDVETICLGDFGLADFYNKEGKYLFTRCGTPGFVAPELLQDQQYDYRVDVYSIGIIMYLLLTGKEPFDGEYQEKVEKNFFGKIDVSLLEITSVGKDFMKRILNINPQKRLTSNQALNHYWFQLHGLYKMTIETDRFLQSSKRLSQFEITKPNSLAYFSPRISRYQSPNKISQQFSSPTARFDQKIVPSISNAITRHFTRNSLILANKEKISHSRNRIQNLIKY